MASLDRIEGRQAGAETAKTVEASGDGIVHLPEGFNLATANLSRVGSDLVLVGADGTRIVVRGFLDLDPLPDLASADGARMAGDLAAHMAGPSAPGQMADAGTVTLPGEPIGTVDNVTGIVVAVRADGTRVELQAGDPVFQGDVLETGPDAAIGIVLADDTSFSMAANGRMVLDEMVYDPGSQQGSMSLSVVQGIFTFVSGRIAKTDPDAMSIDTPVATIGIRGTQVGVDIADGRNLNVVLMEEAGGFVGEVVVRNDGGLVVLNGAHQYTTVSSFALAPSPALIATVGDLIVRFGDSLSHLPSHSGNENSFGLGDEQTESGLRTLQEFDTAAGGGTLVGGTDAGDGGHAGSGIVNVVDGDYTARSEPVGGLAFGGPGVQGSGATAGAGAAAGDDTAAVSPSPAAIAPTVVDGGPAGDALDGGPVAPPVNAAPVLDENDGLALQAGGAAIIGADLLHAADVDDPTDELVFTLLHDPEHGTLYLGGSALTTGGTFTQFDIDNGLLSYEADEPQPFAYAWAGGTPQWDSGGRQPVDQDNLTVPEGSDSVIISFEGEDAGYRNSIGWYRLDGDGLPTDPQFLWADASEDGGTLPLGTTFTLEGLEPGDRFGLFIVQNGAGNYGWLPQMVDAQAIFDFDDHGNLVAGNKSIAAAHIFYTGDSSLNPDGLNHARSGADGDRLMIGFEDLTGGGDNDFNDLFISVRYDGMPALPISDSFSFTATDGTDHLTDMDAAEAGYTVADGEATFRITIDPAAQMAA